MQGGWEEDMQEDLVYQGENTMVPTETDITEVSFPHQHQAKHILSQEVIMDQVEMVIQEIN